MPAITGRDGEETTTPAAERRRNRDVEAANAAPFGTLPAQHFDAQHPQTGARGLLQAVIAQAILDGRTPAFARAVRQWLTSPASGVGSFGWYAEVLHHDVEALRARCLRAIAVAEPAAVVRSHMVRNRHGAA